MAHKRNRRRKKAGWFARLGIGKKIGIVCAAIIVCAAAAAAGVVMAKLSKLDTQTLNSDDVYVNEELDSEITEGYSTFAVFGVDSRSGDLEEGTRTDCIIIVVLDNATKEIKMCSVYRDTLLDIADGAGTLSKCNAAYAYGSYTEAINMLNKNLDLEIDGYVTVDFAAIADAIDLLGGVEIEVKEEELSQLNKYINETAKVAGKTANSVDSAGKQTLDGVQATTYARIRKTTGGDFQRTNRQRTVIEAMVKKIQASDWSSLNKMIDQLLPQIQTSFSATDILVYAKDFTKYKITDSKGFPFDKTTGTVDGYGSIVIPVTLDSNVVQLHEFLYGEDDYSVSSTITEISNRIVSVVGARTPMGDDGSDDYEESTDTEDESAEDTADSQKDTSSDKNGKSDTSDKSEEENPTLVFH
jgi:LCP family protein required for cell wall assembly